MNIVKPYAKILPDININVGVSILRDIEYIARVSHRSEDKVTPDSWERFIRFVVIQKGDWSVVEHRSLTVEAVVDRGISHEWVRHRIGSYTQESTRFVNYGKENTGIKVICPFEDFDIDRIVAHQEWYNAMWNTEASYLYLINSGITPQIARSVLPTCLATKLIITYNLRSWRHFFLMRTTLETHPQMKEVSIPLLHEFQSCIPILYDDIQPNMRQAHNLMLADGDNAK